jgi:hypothetical protein
MQNAECKMQNAECRMQNAEWRNKIKVGVILSEAKNLKRQAVQPQIYFELYSRRFGSFAKLKMTPTFFVRNFQLSTFNFKTTS